MEIDPTVDQLLKALSRNIEIREFALKSLTSFQKMGDSAARHDYRDRALVMARNAKLELERIQLLEKEIGELARRLGSLLA